MYLNASTAGFREVNTSGTPTKPFPPSHWSRADLNIKIKGVCNESTISIFCNLNKIKTNKLINKDNIKIINKVNNK
jgi:hypothetical protein